MRDDLDISGNLPDRVRLEVRGPSGSLTRDNLPTVAVVLDLSDAHAGERTYSIRGRNLNLPAGVVFYRAVPSQLTLHFDQLIFKEEPCSACLREHAPGLSRREPAVQPDRGPNSGLPGPRASNQSGEERIPWT